MIEEIKNHGYKDSAAILSFSFFPFFLHNTQVCQDSLWPAVSSFSSHGWN